MTTTENERKRGSGEPKNGDETDTKRAKSGEEEEASKKEDQEPLKFPDDFPSLKPHFGEDAKIPLVGLLFSAGWCPDCQPVVPKIVSLLKEGGEKASALIKIVYVGSEKSAHEMAEFLKSTGGDKAFEILSFDDSAKERSDLKRHFKTCAEKEMKDVGVEKRDAGIPTLKVLLAKDGSVASKDAVPDVEKLSATEALEQWGKLSDAKES